MSARDTKIDHTLTTTEYLLATVVELLDYRSD